MQQEKLKQALFSLLAKKGAKLIGAADLSGIVNGEMQMGISVAVPVPKKHRKRLTNRADKRILRRVLYLKRNAGQYCFLRSRISAGKMVYQAYANTTKAVKQDDNWCTPLPHKTVATRAGLGWIGKKLSACHKGIWQRCAVVQPADRCAFAGRYANQREPMQGVYTMCAELPCQGIDRSIMEYSHTARRTPSQGSVQGDANQADERGTGIETDLCGLCFAVCPFTQRYLKSGI